MARSAKQQPAAPVVWRDGVHIVGTPIWCDARRARDVCFVSRADALSRSKHGQLISTAETLALIRRQAPSAFDSELSIPLGRPFTLGNLRIELFRSGSAIGASSLVVDVDGTRVAYAGMIGSSDQGLGGSTEPRPCDVLVITSTLATADQRLPPVSEAVLRINDAWRQAEESGGALLALVDGWLEGLDLIHHLAKSEDPPPVIYGHRSIHHGAQRLRAAGVPVVDFSRVTRVRPGALVVWPANRRKTLEAMTLPAKSLAACVSGRAELPGVAAACGAELAVVWSPCADYSQIERYVEATGCSTVYVRGPWGEQLAQALACGRRTAFALGPPQQMSLFP